MKKMLGVLFILLSVSVCGLAFAGELPQTFSQEIEQGNLEQAIDSARKAGVSDAVIVESALASGADPADVKALVKVSDDKLCEALKKLCCVVSREKPNEKVCDKFFWEKCICD